ncbi:MAG: DUF971 domain-containing protein [Gammaproteobacteria bacterium]
MSRVRPTEINFHKVSRILELSFDDGSNFKLPTEYLRVYSPSAEVQGHGPGQEVLQIGKEDVNISRIEPVGHYALCLVFDDNHDTGIYSWEYLFYLGENFEIKWTSYLERLKEAGHEHKSKAD